MQYKFFFALVLLIVFFISIQSCEQPENPNMHEPVKGEYIGIPAIDAITRDIKQDPENMALYVARCEAYSREGMFNEAEVEARKIWEKDPTNWKSARLLAWAYFDNNKSKPAIKTIEKALEIHPDTIRLLLLLSEINLKVKQYDDALISAEKTLKISPLNVEGLFMRGLTLKYIGDTLGAIEDFQTAIEQDADHLDAYMQLGNIFSGLKKKIAIQYYNNALRIDSTAYEALFGKASFYHQNYTSQNGMLELAKSSYEQAIIYHPQESDASYNYALLFMEEKDFNQAHHFFDIAVKYDPQFGDAYYFKGLASEKLGNIEAAIIDYKNAVANNNRFGRAEAALERLSH
ncbi:MAG: tetratricopeptide repeat protein [Saprospiraceae bacterium]|nr:tetratricopeptide repeat protein [Saprospiraceae bacterium]